MGGICRTAPWVAVHFPIALVLVAAFLEVLGWFVWREPLAPATRALLWVSAPCATLTAVAGWILASYESYGTGMAEILERHRWGGVSLVVHLLAALLLREKAERGGSKRWQGAYRGGLLVAAALTILVGHRGGGLVHGLEFLELPL